MIPSLDTPIQARLLALFACTLHLFAADAAAEVVYNNGVYNDQAICGHYSVYYALHAIGLKGVGLGELLESRPPRADGLSGVDMIELIEERGMRASMVKIDSIDRLHDLDERAILWVRSSESADEPNHYVFMAGQQGSRFIVLDGPSVKTLSREELGALWDGTALLVSPRREGSAILWICVASAALVTVLGLSWPQMRKFARPSSPRAARD